MSLVRHFRRATAVSPGLMDAGAASLAGFIGSFYAARFLPTDVLGAYALYLTGSRVAGVVPLQLLFLPARVHALQHGVTDRLRIIPWSIWRGLGVSGAVGLLVLFAAIPVAGQIHSDEVLPLAVTAVLFAVVSPVQDHLRATFHLARKSWVAALMSGVQLVSEILLVLALHLQGVEPGWIPFGSLFMANVLSSLIGLIAVRHYIGWRGIESLATKRIMAQGRPLLGGQLVSVSTGYVALWVVAAVVSAEALGYVEAARVVSQPIFVFSLGLSTVMTPRLMESGFERSREKAKRYSALTVAGIAAFSIPYVALTGWPHELNPALYLIPSAFVLPGLVLVRELGFVAAAIAQVPVSIIYGTGRNREVLATDAVGALSRLGTLATVSHLGAYVIPAGMIVSSLVRLLYASRKWSRYARSTNE